MVEPEQKNLSYEELAQYNQALIQEIASLKVEKHAVWMMLAGTNRRLQMASAAIKAAVSSLLNYDIFWDGANQHEFLETINTSIDQSGRLVKLLTLVFRLEAGNLLLKREPQVLQEIISAVQDHIAKRFPHFAFGLTLPQEGAPAPVDYEFLMLALEFLIEVIEQTGVRRIGIQAVEEPDCWILKFEGLDASQIQIIQTVFEQNLDQAAASSMIPAEHLLRLFIASQILSLQEIQAEFSDSSNHSPRLRLIVPTQLSR
jgi:signal transduction histidine kinase